jgi:hypothetical protein
MLLKSIRTPSVFENNIDLSYAFGPLQKAFFAGAITAGIGVACVVASFYTVRPWEEPTKKNWNMKRKPCIGWQSQGMNTQDELRVAFEEYRNGTFIKPKSPVNESETCHSTQFGRKESGKNVGSLKEWSSRRWNCLWRTNIDQ